MALVLLINYARSGGTLLNKCLGVLPNTIVLSEVHPDGGGWGVEKEKSHVTVWDQAKHWYNIDLKARDFLDAVNELNEYCKDRNKHLIIREWSYLNYNINNTYSNMPQGRLQTLELIKHLNPKVFAFVRNPIDVWISMGKPNQNVFFKTFQQFINEISLNKLKIFRYEDFVRNPVNELRNICEFAGLDFDTTALINYHSFTNVNGDVQKSVNSRGISKNEIRLLPRKPLGLLEITRLNQNRFLIDLNKCLGYLPNYFERKSFRFYVWYIYSFLRNNYSKLRKKQKIKASNPELINWWNDEGDQTHRINYKLSKHSVVFDLGGYEGNWTSEIHTKYNCKVFVFEPVYKFYESIREKFQQIPEVSVFQFGLACTDKKEKLFLQKDGSSILTKSNANDGYEVIELKCADVFFGKYNIQKIDLMKINIEGGEYELLEYLIETGWVKNINNIQVQFHDFVENAEIRMEAIQSDLTKTHELTYQYRFVWENWRLKDSH